MCTRKVQTCPPQSWASSGKETRDDTEAQDAPQGSQPAPLGLCPQHPVLTSRLTILGLDLPPTAPTDCAPGPRGPRPGGQSSPRLPRAPTSKATARSCPYRNSPGATRRPLLASGTRAARRPHAAAVPARVRPAWRRPAPGAPGRRGPPARVISPGLRQRDKPGISAYLRPCPGPRGSQSRPGYLLCWAVSAPRGPTSCIT